MPFDTDRQTLWLIGELYAVERYLLGFLGRLHGKIQVPYSRDKKVIRSLDKVYRFSSLFQDRRPDIVAYVCYIQKKGMSHGSLDERKVVCKKNQCPSSFHCRIY